MGCWRQAPAKVNLHDIDDVDKKARTDIVPWSHHAVLGTSQCLPEHSEVGGVPELLRLS